MWLFWQMPSDILKYMDSWPWFDAVRDEERFKVYIEKARELSENTK